MADVGEVPIIEVHSGNFTEIYPSLLLAVQSSTFIAIDAELSGLGDRKKLMAKGIEERYKAISEVARTRSLISLGLSCFKQTDAAQPSANVGPTSQNGRGPTSQCSAGPAVQFTVQTYNILIMCSENYVVEPNSIKFLLEHGFDFNRQYALGLPYYRGCDKTDGATQQSLRHIFSHLIAARIPLVFHNALVDLVFLYESLYASLPPSMSSFLADCSQIFSGGVWDTKYIAEFVLRMEASFLEYTFRKSLRDNSGSACVGVAYADVTFLKYPDMMSQHIIYSPCGLNTKPCFRDVGKETICKAYAAHGWCSGGSACNKSHDVDMILDAEEWIISSKKKKKRTRVRQRNDRTDRHTETDTDDESDDDDDDDVSPCPGESPATLPESKRPAPQQCIGVSNSNNAAGSSRSDERLCSDGVTDLKQSSCDNVLVSCASGEMRDTVLVSCASEEMRDTVLVSCASEEMRLESPCSMDVSQLNVTGPDTPADLTAAAAAVTTAVSAKEKAEATTIAGDVTAAAVSAKQTAAVGVEVGPATPCWNTAAAQLNISQQAAAKAATYGPSADVAASTVAAGIKAAAGDSCNGVVDMFLTQDVLSEELRSSGCSHGNKVGSNGDTLHSCTASNALNNSGDNITNHSNSCDISIHPSNLHGSHSNIYNNPSNTLSNTPSNPSHSNGNPSNSSQNRVAAHRAGFDAFMTGYIFATYAVKYTARTAVPSSTSSGAGAASRAVGEARRLVLPEEFSNRIYLSGKDFPLQIVQSNFAKCSKGHAEKWKLIMKDDGGRP